MSRRGHQQNRPGILLLLLSFTSCLFGLTAGEPPITPDLSTNKTLYTVAYSHLDSQWRWGYPQVIREFLPNTVRQNQPLFEKYPNYIFNFSGAFRYQLLKEYHPADYQKVRDWVAQGRWFPCGNSWDESDTLLPSSESLIRQVLLGHRFFKREFGTESAEFMLPDCFGFPASLPSVLAHCGIRGFSTQKLTWGSAVGIPFNVGLWEGLDGASVIAALNAGDYNGSVKENLSTSTNWNGRLETNALRSDLFTDYLYHGVGDRGGAPKASSIDWVEQSLASTGPVRVVAARADQMFLDITDAQRAKLPVYRGDLLLTEHSAGSLTSQAYMKRWHRQGELLANAAESAAVSAHLLGAPYPKEKLRRAWELLLATEMHDILPGTSLPKAYAYSWNDAVLAMNFFAETLTHAVGRVAQVLDTKVQGRPLVVYNPLSVPRQDLVEAELEFESVPERLVVRDGAGISIPAQILGVNGNRVRFLFLARAPGLGFAVYSVESVESEQAIEIYRTHNPLKITERSLENNYYRVTLNDQGDVTSIFDKALSKELLSAPMRLAFLYECPKEWPAWNMDWKDRTNPPIGYVEGPAQFRVTEKGPLRVALEVTRNSRNSEFIQTIRLAVGDGGSRVEFDNRIDWQSSGVSLKAEIPLTVRNPVGTYNWEIGKIERGNNDPKKYEVPAKQWFDITDVSGFRGVSILTGGKYGSDKPSDNVVRLTLLYSPAVQGKDFHEQATQDWGRHEFVYGLSAHRGDWRQGKSDWQAARLEQPMYVFETSAHPGHLGRSYSALELSSDQVAVRALKLAEDTDEVIVRLQELNGRQAEGIKLKFGTQVISAVEVNGLEKTIAPVKKARAGLLNFNPYQLRSLAYRLKPAAAVKPLLSTSIKLPFNLDVFSFDENRRDGGCDDVGTTFPAETMSDVLTVEDVKFVLGSREDGKLNAVRCEGQQIALPEGSFEAIYLLATAAHGDFEGEFAVDFQKTTLRVQDWSGYIGQWDYRRFEGSVKEMTYGVNNPLKEITTAYIKRAPVAWFSTHRHNRDGRDEGYAYSYLYKYRLDAAPGAKTLSLPNSPRIRILAATAVNRGGEARPSHPLYDDLTDRKPVVLRNEIATQQATHHP